MTEILKMQLRPSADAIDSAVGDETVLLQLTKGTYYGLDPVGTRVWALLKEGRNPAQICETLTQEFDAPPETIEQDVSQFLEALLRNEIVSEG
jgi:hypothetical protein